MNVSCSHWDVDLDFATEQHTQLIIQVKHLVLDAIVSWKICRVELEDQELEKSPVGPHCLYCDRTAQ